MVISSCNLGNPCIQPNYNAVTKTVTSSPKQYPIMPTSDQRNNNMSFASNTISLRHIQVKNTTYPWARCCNCLHNQNLCVRNGSCIHCDIAYTSSFVVDIYDIIWICLNSYGSCSNYDHKKYRKQNSNLFHTRLFKKFKNLNKIFLESIIFKN